MSYQTAFFANPTVLGIARAVFAATKIPVSVILAQMSIETGYGTSALWRQCRNPAGIKGSGCGAFQSYASYAAAAQGYAATYHNGYYAQVLAVAASGASPQQVAVALGQSPWAGSHYTGNCGSPGCQLIQQITAYNLTQYDTAPAHTAPKTPRQAPPSLVVPIILFVASVLAFGADEALRHEPR